MNYMCKTENLMQLKDGRALGYAEYGDPDGRPVFFFHGWPSSRLFIKSLAQVSAEMETRIIAVDRPGFGISDFQPGRKITDWPEDFAQLADKLGIRKFAVAGHSGGAPYVLVCCKKMPDRITKAAVISGMGPLDLPGAIDDMPFLHSLLFRFGRFLPYLDTVLIYLSLSGGLKIFSEVMISSMPDADKEIIKQNGADLDDLEQAFRQGARGPIHDIVILSKSWGFRLEDVKTKVYLWHGDRDVSVPIQTAKYVAEQLPDCLATYYEGEGHLLISPRWKEILSRLVG
ncbi:MAG: alpha/beta hydrolase [Candidatus Eremiobacteraeota bacterium]|nr:alpha/beta hydrolase [Candidatus Eremiobacteraeota bacterium]